MSVTLTQPEISRPLRTTRKSTRPRASDRSMVATIQPHGLMRFEIGVVATKEDAATAMGTTQVQDTRRASSMVRGTGCRETNLRVRRREKNVLDIPFYRSA